MSASFDLRRLDTVQLVPPTPFSPDCREVAPERLSALVRKLAGAGIRVFLPGAGTGEFHSLSAEEVVTCVRATREAAGPEGVVMAPIGMGVGHSLAIARPALEAGADVLLLMPPIHPYLADDGFRDYFLAITDAVGVPILAYKRGPVPSDDLLVALAGEGRLLGVKYAVNDLNQFTRFADRVAGRTGLYCGTAERWAPFFALAGATGYTSGAGILCPRLTLKLHAAIARADHGEAFRLLRLIRPIEDFRARDGDSFNITLLKYGLQLCGHDFGPPRPPQRRLTPDQEVAARAMIESVLAAEAALRDT